MSRVLHLIKGEDVALALTVIAQQQAAGDDVAVALLPGAAEPPWPAGIRVHRVPAELAWDALLERIFDADQVLTW